MADPVTLADIAALSLGHSDIRREAAANTNEIIKEGLKESFNTRGDVKDSRHDVASRINDATNSLSRQVDAIDDTLTAQLFTISRESADNRAQITGLGYQIRDGFVASAKDSEINALKTQIETAKQTTYLSDKIDDQGERTRALINDLQYNDLNRRLVERNAELVEERHAHHHWRHSADMGQWAAVNSQLQALQSQFQETRQGMINFGTMAGVGQSSTSNNVR